LKSALILIEIGYGMARFDIAACTAAWAAVCLEEQRIRWQTQIAVKRKM
jgi:hypothetical protein